MSPGLLLRAEPTSPTVEDWVKLDDDWDPDDALVYESIRAMRAQPLRLSATTAAVYAEAKQNRVRRVTKPLSLG